MANLEIRACCSSTWILDRRERKGRHWCLGDILECRVVVLYGVNRMIVHFFKASILPSSLYCIHPFLLNHPGGKYLLLQGIESVSSPNISDDICLFCPSSMVQSLNFRLYNFVAKLEPPGGELLDRFALWTLKQFSQKYLTFLYCYTYSTSGAKFSSENP